MSELAGVFASIDSLYQSFKRTLSSLKRTSSLISSWLRLPQTTDSFSRSTALIFSQSTLFNAYREQVARRSLGKKDIPLIFFCDKQGQIVSLGTYKGPNWRGYDIRRWTTKSAGKY